LRFKDKVVIVIGAAMGIGREIALSFAREGANVVLFDISDKVFETSKEVESLGVKALAIKGDVARKDDVERTVSETIATFNRIDILVNNAGIYPFKQFIEMTEEDWDKVIAVNLKGVFLFTKAVVPHMIKQRYGRIINISSIAGSVVGFPNLTHYCASKAGVLGFTKALALELAQYNITVNAIAPGPIETPGTRALSTTENVRTDETTHSPRQMGQTTRNSKRRSLPSIRRSKLHNRTTDNRRRRIHSTVR